VAVSPDDFRGALGSWASGVTVVTTELHGLMYGITVSSFASLSLDPPLITVSLANDNRLPSMIEQSGHFAVSILADDQREISLHFAQPGRVPATAFGHPVPTRRWTTGSPLIEGAVAQVDCELEQSVPGGDHTIMIGRVTGAHSDPGKLPLVYFRRDYRSLGEVNNGG